MKENLNMVIRIRIIELEDKLMDLIELSSKYERIPVPVLDFEMIEVLNEIEYLESLIN